MESLNDSDRQKIFIFKEETGNSKMNGYIGDVSSFTMGYDSIPEYRTRHEEDGITINSTGCILSDSILIKQIDSNNVYQLYSWDLNNCKFSLVIFSEKSALNTCYQTMKDKDMNLSNGDINDNLNAIGANMDDITHIYTDCDPDFHPLDRMFTLEEGKPIVPIKR